MVRNAYKKGTKHAIQKSTRLAAAVRINTDYRHIRAALIRRGSSLHAWARHHHYPYTSVISAARGERHGKQSQKILAQLLAELGL